MKQQDQISPKESLQIIEEMLQKTKAGLVKSSPFFLIWGFLMILAGIGEYLLKEVYPSLYFFLVWPVAGLIGGVMSSIYANRKTSEEKTMSFPDKLISQIWMGYILTLVLVIIGAVSFKQNPGTFVMMLTGLPTFLTGRILNFKPLVYGALSFWILGLISIFIPDALVSLIFSVSILTGYIIPGLLLRRTERQNTEMA